MAQSGRILSVVITVEAFAEREVALRRDADAGASDGLPAEFNDDEDDIAEETFPSGRMFAYIKPLRKSGGSYVTPNSACWQYGQLAGSDTKDSCCSLSGRGGAGFEGSGWSCSGG